MDIDEEYDTFNIESLMTLSRHKSSSPYNLDPSNENLGIVMHDLEEKILVAGRRAGIVERTAQTWAKRLDNDPNWDIFGKKTNKINRPKA
ncbi:hypothetical protein G6F62_007998 [Rhizopus arrhizus]|nr:hypothetical protein G6F24_010755 [Rhizopus arrhizus]KAG0785937.1 hypothetical protein G6F22_007786 [Rhizopus arrhizus]KAG0793438.1 hypothetical protein G6F21_003621 [Rhizopus arrhizus]KAG0814580.1 hypothetical protein G6F20_004656 [Rhizopus arrhizus]KAG0823165.1 hypothetical protein G6F19_010999 [Rhizopus arrhizus]